MWSLVKPLCKLFYDATATSLRSKHALKKGCLSRSPDERDGAIWDKLEGRRHQHCKHHRRNKGLVKDDEAVDQWDDDSEHPAGRSQDHVHCGVEKPCTAEALDFWIDLSASDCAAL